MRSPQLQTRAKRQPGVLLAYEKAIRSLKSGARLLKERNGPKFEYFIVPGGRVNEDTANRIIARVDVVGDDRGLFEDTHQTWRIAP